MLMDEATTSLRTGVAIIACKTVAVPRSLTLE
jgi:hypothetical protein